MVIQSKRITQRKPVTLSVVETEMKMDLNIFLALFSLLNCVFVSSIEVTSVTIDTTKVIHTTSDKFISVAIDSGVLRRHWEKFKPRSPKVITLAHALTPCYLRVGGTDADFLIFDDESKSHSTITQTANSNSDYTNITDKTVIKVLSDGDGFRRSEPKKVSRSRRDLGLYSDHTNYTMSAELYDELHKFVSDVGFDLIFDLNVLLRRGDGWDPTNAEKLMNYTVSHGYKMAGWELGNEPNAFYHQFGFRIEAYQLAQDYVVLGNLLKRYKEYENTTVLGPSTTRLVKKHVDDYFESFLTNGGKDVVTAATFHQYYINGRTATVDDFTKPDVLNVLFDEVQMGVNLTRLSGSKAQSWIGETSSAWGGGAEGLSDRYVAAFISKAESWIGETSSAWGGGAEGLSDRYVAAFMWLDKLGIAAAWGVDVIVRQTFYGGHYALIDSNTLDPNPDYWLTLMYKKLVGSKVLRVLSPNSRGNLRVYSHCVNSHRSGYQSGAVVFYIMNLGDPVQISFPNFPSSSIHHVYTFTPQDGDLKSQSVLLNGILLQMIDDTRLPNLMIPVKGAGPVNMDSKTYSFVVFPEANLDICK